MGNLVLKELVKFDLRSLLVVLVAFLGNAKVAGLDLVLTILLPVLLVLHMRTPWVLLRNRLLLFIALTLVLTAASIRAPLIGIPYLNTYYIWPYKALALMFLVTFRRDIGWPLGNMLALAIICFTLFALGHIENGRLVSLFGPNMLYRIFGFLLIFSLMSLFEKRNLARGMMMAFAGFGIYAALLTGSSGAIMVIALAIAITMLRFSIPISGGITVLLFCLVAVYVPLTDLSFVTRESPVFCSRLIYKIATLESNTRLIGWAEMLTAPFSLIGYSHADFSQLWRYGYEYPHNIFIELYAFYGLAGVTMVGVIVAEVIAAVPNMIKGRILELTFIVLLLGSMFSGDLSDNYGVIGLAAGLLISRTRKKSIFHTTQYI